ncbi:hypothetical protein EXN66_Car012033 [Channa argus]|uniref:Uncharacterized protein n=1 Tax=Channa argus TaxID=215402 RepID=A0A6G1Q2C8_CHAAH|nr:hypothetical protein EXN66_Car012033 [Channa argus]
MKYVKQQYHSFDTTDTINNTSCFLTPGGNNLALYVTALLLNSNLFLTYLCRCCAVLEHFVPDFIGAGAALDELESLSLSGNGAFSTFFQ